MPCGSLFDCIHIRKQKLTADQIISIASQTARGMLYLHTYRYVFRIFMAYDLVSCSTEEHEHKTPSFVWSAVNFQTNSNLAS